MYRKRFLKLLDGINLNDLDFVSQCEQLHNGTDVCSSTNIDGVLHYVSSECISSRSTRVLLTR